MIECLQKILQDRCLEDKVAADNSIRLKEPRAGMNVDIHGDINSPFLAIRLRKVSHLSCLSDGPWKQICDYLLIARVDGNNHAIFIELKKSMTDEAKPLEQLRRSLPIWHYLHRVCGVELGNTLEFNVSYAFIAEKFSKRLDKQRTRTTHDASMPMAEHHDIKVARFVGRSRINLSALVAP